MNRLKHPAVIIILAAIGVLAAYIYFQFLGPLDVESKGKESSIVWITLATSIVSFLTSLLGVILKIIEIRHSKEIK